VLAGEADWITLQKIKAHYANSGIPIISNGGIGNMGDFYSCLQLTGVDGIMVSGPSASPRLSLLINLHTEAILEDPAFFSRPIPPVSFTNQVKYPLTETPLAALTPHPTVTLTSPTQFELALEYLSFCELYPPHSARTVRSHLMKFLYRYPSPPSLFLRLLESILTGPSLVDTLQSILRSVTVLVMLAPWKSTK
jgi:tRNA-dihydrouridine synthase 4